MHCKPFTGVTETEWVRLPGGEAYMEIVSDIYRWQTLVTYTHRDSWDGFQPEACSASLACVSFPFGALQRSGKAWSYTWKYLHH